jgi:DNA polymerase-1
MAFLSKELATIYSQIPLDVTFEDLAYRGADRECVEALFQELGFEQILNRITIWQ